MLEQNFLFGLTALESGLINATQFVDAGREWMAVPSHPLAEILTERGWLTPQDRSTLENRLEREIEPPTIEAPTTAPGLGGGDTIIIANDYDPNMSREDGDSTHDNPFHPADGFALRSTPPSNGERDFGRRYKHVTLYARGGSGLVYRANDTVLGREVALKRLKDEYQYEDRMVSRFLAEARITSGLVHPNIIPIYDLCPLAEQPFYSMTFLVQSPLKDAIKRHHTTDAPDGPKPQGLRDLLEKFIGVCNAIAFAHEHGVIHRDIKGQNVILGEFGEAIVLDWGLAKQLDRDDDPLAEPRPNVVLYPDTSVGGTMPGQAIGTPNYMPPEQAAGRHDLIGKRSDVFGLGALLYLILTDRPPFDDPNREVVLELARKSIFPTPSSLKSSTPPALEAICLKAMEKDSADRYESASALADDIRRWLNDEPVSVHPEKWPARAGRWSRKNQPVVVGTVAILITTVLSLTVGIWRVGIASQATLAEEHQKLIAQAGANENYRTAVNALKKMLRIVMNDLPQVRDPKVDRVRLETAKTLSGFVGELAERNPGLGSSDWDVKETLAGFLREAAKVQELSYHFAEAEGLLRRAIAILAADGDGAALPSGQRRLVNELQHSLALTILQRGDPRSAEIPASVALRLAIVGREAEPGNVYAIRTEANALILKGQVALERGDASTAAEMFVKALAMYETLLRSETVGPNDMFLATIAEHGHGCALREAGRVDDASATLAKASARARFLTRKAPENIDFRHVLARCETELAITLARAGKRDDALELLNESRIEAQKHFLVERPMIVGFCLDLATAYIARGEILGGDLSEQDLLAAVKHLDDALVSAPEAVPCRASLGRAKVGLARLALARNNLVDARQFFKEAQDNLSAVQAINDRNYNASAVRSQVEELTRRLNAGRVSP